MFPPNKKDTFRGIFFVLYEFIGLEPVTSCSKSYEQSDIRIWEKQSGGLFCSRLVSRNCCSHQIKKDTFRGIFFVLYEFIGLEPVTSCSKSYEQSDIRIWEKQSGGLFCSRLVSRNCCSHQIKKDTFRGIFFVLYEFIGLEPVTSCSKSYEQSDIRIWEKQSGGLFCSRLVSRNCCSQQIKKIPFGVSFFLYFCFDSVMVSSY